jgi:hypothetical protein
LETFKPLAEQTCFRPTLISDSARVEPISNNSFIASLPQVSHTPLLPLSQIWSYTLLISTHPLLPLSTLTDLELHITH